MGKNIILADCKKEEIDSFAQGVTRTSGCITLISSSMSNWSQRNKLINLYRYIKYFSIPFMFFLIDRKKYKTIIGWQQFYAILFAFYCKLFHVKKVNSIVVCNFTYKKKKGFIGKIYHVFMKYALNNKYLDYFHVPSFEYMKKCCNEIGLSPKKFIVTNFGVPDIYQQWKNSTVDAKDYILSIGRSNRDFDFLIQVWSDDRLKQSNLVIISDTYHTPYKLSPNIKIINNITGDAQFPWIINAKWIIIPIADGNICSGDTVLLNSMMLKKVVTVTKPSTLQEMYIQNGINGYAIEKDKEKIIPFILNISNNPKKMSYIEKNARDSYIRNFSRISMGEKIGTYIKTT